MQHLASLFARVRGQVKRSEVENGERDAAVLLHERMAGRRPAGFAGATGKELASVKDLVERRLREAKERLRQLGAGEDAVVHPAVAVAPAAAPFGGELGAVFYGASGGSDGAGPSGSGSAAAMEAFNQGCDLGFSWSEE